jgi:hypothetical protein
MDDQDAVPSLRRRGVIASAVAALTGLFLTRGGAAHAQSAEEPLILGGQNRSFAPTRLDAETEANALEVVNTAGGGGIVGAVGQPPEIPELPGVWAFGEKAIGLWAQSRVRAGVLGITGEYGDIPLDVRAGLWGIGGDWPGAWGQSQTNAGVLGLSDTFSGVVGVVGGADYEQLLAGSQIPPSGVWGLASEGEIGTWGQSRTGIGAVGQSGHIGMWAAKGEGWDLSQLEPAAFHSSARGLDPSTCARSESGPAVMAETQDGVALRALVKAEGGIAIIAEHGLSGDALLTFGRIRSDMVGSGVVKAHQRTSPVIPCPAVTDESHVSITFNANPYGAGFWVERLPGRGFILHLTRPIPRDLPFTYSAIDPSNQEPIGEDRGRV